MKKINIKVPGRICLLGDKSDLLNRPVIAASISKFFDFNIKKINEPFLKFNFPEKNKFLIKNINEKNNKDEFFKFLSQISYRLKDHISPIEVNISGDLPIGCGLSSSAACSIGYIKGLTKLFNLNFNTKEIAELAYQVERNDLGIMCGRMDQYSIAYSGLNIIETNENTKVTEINIKSLPFIIADSNEPRMAKKILNLTMEKLKLNDKLFIECFESINDNVLEGIKALNNNNLNLLGKLMNKHQEAEKAMNASTKKLDLMCKIALNSGALGAKQIGAGGGGCMIALCPNNENEVLIELKKLKIPVWKANLFKY